MFKNHAPNVMTELHIPADFWKFIDHHRNDDVTKLRLKFHGKGPEWVDDAISHLECLKKCGHKFGSLQPELMLVPLSVEQSTSGKVALLHGKIARRTAGTVTTMLDMTCGMGIDLRALTDQLRCHATGIELNPKVAATTVYNLRKYPNTTIICGDSVEWLNRYDGNPFDLVFIDPARRGDAGQRVFNIHHCQPDVEALLPILRKKSRFVMVKLSPMLDITQTLRDLPPTTEIHVVDENGECREVLCVLDLTKGTSSAPTIVIHSGEIEFAFDPERERNAQCVFGNGMQGQWIFEPSPAAMKAQPFGILCSDYGLKKLHPNTHLFISDSKIDGIPGKWHEIADVHEFSSSSLKRLAKQLDNADVAVRNFPLKAEELKKRLKIKSGDSFRIIGATARNNGNDSRMLYVLHKTPVNT